MEEPKLTRISVSIGNKTITWETKNIDCDLDEILDGFSGILLGHTWLASTIYKGMKDYGQEYCDLYNFDKDE